MTLTLGAHMLGSTSPQTHTLSLYFTHTHTHALFFHLFFSPLTLREILQNCGINDAHLTARWQPRPHYQQFGTGPGFDEA